MDVSQKRICPEKQWLYSGDTQVFFIKIMLISLFSPGARQSFFSTITQSAGHRSVYLHCVWKVNTLKSFEVTGDLDESRSQDSWLPKNHQVYPGLPWRIHRKGVISVVREAVLSVRRDARDGLGGLAMARGHSCRSRFEEFSAAIANWCSSMKFNPASYDIFVDVLFCQVQQVQWISELQIGAPDFNGCYMSRSPLQSFLEVQESRFQVRPCHDQRSTFYWNIMFWSSSMSLTYAEGTLLGHPWANVKNERNVSSHWIWRLNHHLSNSAMRISINSMYRRVSVRVSAVLRQCARGSGERGAPDGTRELADGQAPLGCTGGPQALEWPKDVNFNGYILFLTKFLPLTMHFWQVKWIEYQLMWP